METGGTFLPVAPSRFEREESRLKILAPAKINLSLGVGPLRSDGFHDIDSVVCRIGLYDRISLTHRCDGRIGFSSSGFNAGPDAENLAFLAAKKIAQGRGVEIHLEKMIPPGSGLGGGSSDAAAILIGLNEFLHLGMDTETLASHAAELGSDVPLFLGGPAARIKGRGEVLEPVEIAPMTIVLHTPSIHCSTAEVYAKFDEMDPEVLFRMPAELLADPPSKWRDGLENQLTVPATFVSPELSEKMELIRESTGIRPHLTGSGSGIFIPCDDDREAAEVISSFPGDLQVDSVAVRTNPW